MANAVSFEPNTMMASGLTARIFSALLWTTSRGAACNARNRS
jgi:hypothetical protein